jgi:cytochrome c peroxidase
VAACGGDAAGPTSGQPSPDGGARVPEGGDPTHSPPPLPWPAERLGPPPDPADNPTTPEKIELGRLLFYDPIVSSDRKVACATCHSEFWGMSDALPRSVGVEGGPFAGPGREGPLLTRRNSQTLWNVAYRPLLFWDGRATSLEEQALLPFEAPEELNRDPADVAAEMAAIPEYQALFAEAFPDSADPVTVANLTRALGAFQRTLVSSRALYDAYVDGDARALSPLMVRGMFVFAEAGCQGCHEPPAFDSPRFEDRAVPALDGIADTGRHEVTGREEDRGRFLVPPLRNVRETGPYFHTGAALSLDDAVRHEVRVSVDRGESAPLVEDDIVALVEFVKKALIDRTLDPHRPLAVPSGLPVPIDSTRILR